MKCSVAGTIEPDSRPSEPAMRTCRVNHCHLTLASKTPAANGVTVLDRLARR